MKKTGNKKVWAVPLDQGPKIPAPLNVTMMKAAMALLTPDEIAEAVAAADQRRIEEKAAMEARKQGNPKGE